MTAGWLVVALAVAALGAGVVWVALPIWRGAPADAADDARVVGLLVQREAVLAALRDLDDDVRDGRLGPMEHGALRADAVAGGAAVLAALDRLADRRAGHADAGATAVEVDVRRARERSVGGT